MISSQPNGQIQMQKKKKVSKNKKKEKKHIKLPSDETVPQATRQSDYRRLASALGFSCTPLPSDLSTSKHSPPTSSPAGLGLGFRVAAKGGAPMSASGFGRDAGPLNRGPGTAPFAFGAGAAAASTPPAPAPFPSARPVAPIGPPAATAAASRFPSPRPQLAATPRPPATSPVPVPSSSAPRGPAFAHGAANPVRFPSSRPAIDPGVPAATARHVGRHLQPQPR